MPRVGSSRISTRGVIASHLPRTTFCWLPPERFTTGRSSGRRLHAEAGHLGGRHPPLARAVEEPEPRGRGAAPGATMFCGDAHRQHQPVPLAVLGGQVDAARGWRRAGWRGRKARPSSCMEPPSAGARRRSLHQLRPAGADEAREAEDLAAARRERDGRRRPRHQQVVHRQHDVAAAGRPAAAGSSGPAARGRPSGPRSSRASRPRGPARPRASRRAGP